MVSRKTALVGVGVVVVLAVVAIFLIGGGGGPPSPGGPSVKTLMIKLTEVEEEKKEWVPSQVFLKVGDTVRLTVINGDDDDEHEFAIPDLDVESDEIPPANGQVVLEFEVEKAGRFNFIDPSVPDWGSEQCQKERGGELEEKEPVCVPPGEIIVQE